MLLTRDQIDRLLIPEPLSDLHKFAKARPFSQYEDGVGSVRKHMCQRGITRMLCHAGLKKDGFSVTVEPLPDGSWMIRSRTPVGTVRRVIDAAEIKHYLTELAIEMRVQLKCELVGYIDGEEVGYSGLPAVLKLLAGGCSSGRIHVKAHVFGVHSAGGGSADLLPPGDLANLLDSFLVKGNALMQPVECEKYLMELYDDGKGGKEIAFKSEDGERTYAHNPAQFAQFLLDKAAGVGAEGYVLALPPEVFRLRPLAVDTWGTGRYSHLIKIKPENHINILACRVEEYKLNPRQKAYLHRSHVYLYGKSGDGGLSFVGTATGHKRLEAMLDPGKVAFKFNGKEQRAWLYHRKPEVVRRLLEGGLAVQIATMCNAFSTGKYAHVQGLKYSMQRIAPLDASQLTNTAEVAIQNDHYLAIRDACDKLAAYTGKRRHQSSDDEDGDSKPRSSPRQEEAEESQSDDSGSSGSDTPGTQILPAFANTLVATGSSQPSGQAPSQATQATLVYTPGSEATEPCTIDKRAVYVYDLAVPSADMPALLAVIQAHGAVLLQEGETAENMPVFGVFKRRSIEWRNGPGVCYSFLEAHPGATLVTPDELEAALEAY